MGIDNVTSQEGFTRAVSKVVVRVNHMQLRDDIRRFIDEQVRDGRFPDAESVIAEAVLQFMLQPEFAPDELDRLIAEGEASGEALDGEAVFKEFAKLRSRSTAE